MNHRVVERIAPRPNPAAVCPFERHCIPSGVFPCERPEFGVLGLWIVFSQMRRADRLMGTLMPERGVLSGFVTCLTGRWARVTKSASFATSVLQRMTSSG